MVRVFTASSYESKGWVSRVTMRREDVIDINKFVSECGLAPLAGGLVCLTGFVARLYMYAPVASHE